MTCKECNKLITPEELKTSTDFVGVGLCDHHTNLLIRVMKQNKTPKEAITLYYKLKEEGLNPMIEWWDGSRSVDIAISRVKLNIDIGTDYELITHKQALKELEQTMLSFKNGFTNIRIPHILVKNYLDDTVNYVVGIAEGLRTNLKAI